jgi:hypothetical protein
LPVAGKAFVIIKVVAERIVPIDYEFNVWRKSQAIVTRNIQIDLKTNEERRRLYDHVMQTGGRMPGTIEEARQGVYIYNPLVPLLGKDLVWLLLYTHRHRSILGAAGHIILTPANQMMEE